MEEFKTLLQFESFQYLIAALVLILILCGIYSLIMKKLKGD